MDAILQARGLTRRFHGLTAVQGVGFDLHPGKILGLIGPNGAGKTTLVNLLSGTLAPSSGQILYRGERVEGVPAYRRARMGIARTFQLMKPFPGLDVLDNVAVGSLFGAGRIGQLRRAREAAAEHLTFVGLAHRAEQRADSLSGPDRKRLELAKALALRPKVLLLDEVMAGLNLAEIDEVIEVIRKVRAEGIAILVIEHVMKAIQHLSDHLLVLHHGQPIAEGPADRVLNDPQVVEAYLGRRRL